MKIEHQGPKEQIVLHPPKLIRLRPESAFEFGAVLLILNCGKFTEKIFRCLVAKSGVGTLGAIELDPIGVGIAGVVDAEEQSLVEKLAVQPAVIETCRMSPKTYHRLCSLCVPVLCVNTQQATKAAYG